MKVMARVVDSFEESVIDYPETGFCVSVFLTGCEHNCKNCHNKQMQNINYSINTKDKSPLEFLIGLREYAERVGTKNVAIMGGDPLFSTNLEFTKEVLKLNKNLNILIYTGYDIKYVKKNNVTGFKYIKTGLFEESKFQNPVKTKDKMVFASKNQKLYNSKFKRISKKGVFKF